MVTIPDEIQEIISAAQAIKDNNKESMLTRSDVLNILLIYEIKKLRNHLEMPIPQ